MIEPGLIKAFRIGYHLISQLQHRTVVAIARDVSSSPTQRRLRNHPWIQKQVARDFARSEVQSGIDNDKLEHLKGVIDTLAMVFDNNTCTRLKILCDPVPCFPKSLERDNPPQIRVDKRSRYISEPQDLRLLLAFLEQLDL